MAKYYEGTEVFSEPGENCHESQESQESDEASALYCKLFGDLVVDEVCGLRRKMLSSRQGFSCKGCVTNIALTRPTC